jgi:hypothetical protein
MAKTSLDNPTSTTSADEEQKLRKKQAKREAKKMLAVEKARVAMQKAEKKIAKAQVRFEARNAHLRDLEAQLDGLRTSSQESEVSVPDTGFAHQEGQPEPENATEIPSPAETEQSSPSSDGQEEAKPVSGTSDSNPATERVHTHKTPAARRSTPAKRPANGSRSAQPRTKDSGREG